MSIYPITSYSVFPVLWRTTAKHQHIPTAVISHSMWLHKLPHPDNHYVALCNLRFLTACSYVSMKDRAVETSQHGKVLRNQHSLGVM